MDLGSLMSHEEAIRKILEQHSGGLKFTELMTILMSAKNRLANPNIDPDMIEKLLRNFPNGEIKVLDYTWRTINRAKMFIYTP